MSSEDEILPPPTDINAEFKAAIGGDSPKPNVVVVGDRKSYYVFWREGIEGFHKWFSEYLTKEYGRPHAAYLNYGYFHIKPMFHTIRNVMNGETVIKQAGRAHYRQGIFELRDAITGQECVLWCYTKPKNLNEWNPVKEDLETILSKALINGIKPNEDGYLPIVVKIGKAPTITAGRMFAKVVGFTDDSFDKGLLYDLEIPGSVSKDTLPVNTKFEGKRQG